MSHVTSKPIHPGSQGLSQLIIRGRHMFRTRRRVLDVFGKENRMVEVMT